MNYLLSLIAALFCCACSPKSIPVDNYNTAKTLSSTSFLDYRSELNHKKIQHIATLLGYSVIAKEMLSDNVQFTQAELSRCSQKHHASAVFIISSRLQGIMHDKIIYYIGKGKETKEQSVIQVFRIVDNDYSVSKYNFSENTVVDAVMGAFIGSRIGGGRGFLVGASVGAAPGSINNPLCKKTIFSNPKADQEKIWSDIYIDFDNREEDRLTAKLAMLEEAISTLRNWEQREILNDNGRATLANLLTVKNDLIRFKKQLGKPETFIISINRR